MFSQNPVFIPGPTNMPEALRKAADMPTLDHRSPLFGQILRPALAGVKKVLKSESAEIFIFPSTGTGGWETAISNTLSAGEQILAARYGMFSHRWIDMCQRHSLDVKVVEAPWGGGLPAERYAEILTADRSHCIRAVLVTHNETATGVKSDVAAVRRALDAARHPALLFVDGVSSIGSMDFRMDEWGVSSAIFCIFRHLNASFCRGLQKLRAFLSPIGRWRGRYGFQQGTGGRAKGHGRGIPSARWSK